MKLNMTPRIIADVSVHDVLRKTAIVVNDLSDTVQNKLRELVSVKDFGATGDGVTDDTAEIQAALDYIDAQGGGTVLIPWPESQYLITSTITIPNHTKIVGDGMTDPYGSDGVQFLYNGTSVAFHLGADVAGNCRGVSLQDIGVELTANGATGFKIQRARDVRIDGCAVDMSENNQVGFLLDGARIVKTSSGTVGQFTITVSDTIDLAIGQVVIGTGFTGDDATITNIVGTTVTLSVANVSTFSGESIGFGSAGVFDCNFYRLSSYCGSTNTGAVHYRLTGSDATGSSGRCNSNQFYGIRGGGAGKGLEIGPSLINSFYGVEFESLSNHYIHCLSGAENNVIYDAYLGDNEAIGANKLFYCDSGAIGNHLTNYRAGSAGEAAVYLGPTSGNHATHILGDRFVGSSSARAYNIRVQEENYNRVELRANGLYMGSGASSASKVDIDYVENTSVATDYNTDADYTFNINLSQGHKHQLRIQSGVTAGRTMTIALPTNRKNDDVFTLIIRNVSGSTQNLSWTSGYTASADSPALPATIATTTFLVMNFIYSLNSWVRIS
jgi:hypothetical protein